MTDPTPQQIAALVATVRHMSAMMPSYVGTHDKVEELCKVVESLSARLRDAEAERLPDWHCRDDDGRVVKVTRFKSGFVGLCYVDAPVRSSGDTPRRAETFDEAADALMSMADLDEPAGDTPNRRTRMADYSDHPAVRRVAHAQVVAAHAARSARQWAAAG